jgi:hypothetical protein
LAPVVAVAAVGDVVNAETVRSPVNRLGQAPFDDLGQSLAGNPASAWRASGR